MIFKGLEIMGQTSIHSNDNQKKIMGDKKDKRI